LAVCGHYRPPTGEGIWIAYSRDNGQSWGPPQTITTRKYQEPVFIYTDGKLVGLVRENEACAYHQFVSRDLGATWHMTERAIQGHATAVHPSPFLAVDPGNAKRLYALVSERAPANRISLWETLGDTVSWRRLGLVAKEDGGWDWTYPWMTHLGGNAWYLVYYKGSKESASIHGARLEIPDPVSPGL
jgi:hypothetical protein